MSDLPSGGAARYEEAFDTLELAASASAGDVKRAYRRAVAAHPPDRDPDRFQDVRAAYELLTSPESALAVICVPETHVPPPALLPAPRVELDHALPLATMRAMVAEIDAKALLGDDDGD